MKFPPIRNWTGAFIISVGGFHRYAAGGFEGESWMASSMCGSSKVAAVGGVVVEGVGAGRCRAAWGGEVMVKPPTRSVSGT